MFCEHILLEAKNADEQKKLELLGEFYVCNLSLFLKMQEDYRIRSGEEDDFNQLCYFALIDACNAYYPGPIPMLAFVRRCILHQYFLFRLHFHFPVKLSYKTYKRAMKAGIEYVDEECLLSYSDMDENFNKVEEKLCIDVIWKSVKEALNDLDYQIIFSFYKEEKPFCIIAEEVHMNIGQVKNRKSKALRRLRSTESIRMLAYSIYGIGGIRIDR